MRQKVISKNYNSADILWGKTVKRPEPPNKNDEFFKTLNEVHHESFFYNFCIFGQLNISVGDFVLISNADSFSPKSLDTCNIGEVIYLYEKFELKKNEDPCRAIVRWYSRVLEIPKKFLKFENIPFDTEKELIQDFRPFDTDISVETIFEKCSVKFGMEYQTPSEILGKHTRNPAYACRFKLVKKTITSYVILPCNQICEENSRKTPNKTPAKRSIPQTPKSANKNIFSVVKSTEKRRSSYLSVVSPIKIIRKEFVDVENDNLSDCEIDTKTSTDLDPLTPKRKNLSVKLSDIRVAGAKKGAFNYSVVSEDHDELKLTLRVEEKCSREQSCSPTGNVENNVPVRRMTRKRSQDQQNMEMVLRELDNNSTPQKKNPRRESVDNVSTPKSALSVMTRRRSILKTPGGTPSFGTPKKSIQLSNIVEELAFDNKEETLRTPRRRSVMKPIMDSYDDEDYRTTSSRSGRKKKKIADVDEEDENRWSGEDELPRTPKSNRNEPQTPKGTRTPASRRKLIREGVITPTLATKELNINRRKSDLQLTRERLHVSAVPKSLPCRESEYENIYSYLVRKIEDQSGGCMYISGVPGTGKTATVTEVIHTLRQEFEEATVPDFEFVEINGLRLTEPQQAYVQIYRQITGKTLPWKQAYTLLQKRFMTPSPKRLPTILLIDELDIICNRRQDVVYNLLDWSTKSAAKLAVITIANTMDLPERFLHGKVTSRLGLTRLTFLPYTFKQLQTIVTERLAGSDTFKSEAVQLVARKIAAVSGDARRALDICRRATEIAENSVSKGISVTVDLSHVQKALGEMISSGKIQAIKRCSKMEKLFLQAVSAEVIRTGVEECNLLGVYTQMESLAAFSRIQMPPVDLTLVICSRLGEMRLIICEPSRKDLYRKILLNVSSDDIHFALQDFEF